MTLRASNKYLAGTEGQHNISSCHLLYSRLVICSSSSSSMFVVVLVVVVVVIAVVGHFGSL